MKCEVCGKSPPKDNVVLHRMNGFGVTGIWRCENCLPEGFVIDSEVKNITRIIQEDNNKKTP